LVISPTTLRLALPAISFLNLADAEVARGSEGLDFDTWCDWRPVRMLSPSLGCLHAGATIGLSVSTLAAVGLPGDLIRRRRRSKAASEPWPSSAKLCPPGTTRMTRRCSGRSTPSTPQPLHPRARRGFGQYLLDMNDLPEPLEPQPPSSRPCDHFLDVS
jgi:hypothetical protein